MISQSNSLSMSDEANLLQLFLKREDVTNFELCMLAVSSVIVSNCQVRINQQRIALVIDYL